MIKKLLKILSTPIRSFVLLTQKYCNHRYIRYYEGLNWEGKKICGACSKMKEKDDKVDANNQSKPSRVVT